MSGWRRLVAAAAALLAACGAPAPPVQEADVTLPDGARLHYRVVGAGPDTVLVLPGGPAFGGAYLEPLVAPLADRHAFVIPDLRGRGASDTMPTAPWSITTVTDAADALALTRALRLGRHAIVSHHYGSTIATALARADSSVTRVAMLAPYPLRDLYVYDLASEGIDSALRLRNAGDARAGLAQRDPVAYCRRYWTLHLRPLEDPRPRTIAALAEPLCAASAVHLAGWSRMKQYVHPVQWDFRDSVRAVRQPVLVLQGRGDGSRPAEGIAGFWARVVSALPPEGRYLELPGSPLFPWVEERRAATAALGAFLAGGWPADAARLPLAESRDSVVPGGR
ncbi:MAG: alpha/beta hydrolase [Gemmatimonadales bacterium]|nr:alpha/beta hydrolase [Gemmatimonadales bacterium]